MVSEEDLAPFLAGSQGVVGLDLAREVVELRKALADAQASNAELTLSAQASADTAEASMAASALAKERLQITCESLANMCAGLREYLGT